MKYINRITTQFVFSQVKVFPLSLAVMFVLAFYWALDFAFRPYLLKIILDRLSEISHQTVYVHLTIPVLGYIGMSFGLSLLYRAYGYFVEIKMIPVLRKNIGSYSTDRLMKQTHTFFLENYSGSLSNKINVLIKSIPEFLQMLVDYYTSQFLALTFSLVALYQANPIFAKAMFTWCAVFIVGSFYCSQKLAQLSDTWSESGSVVTGKIVDSLSNILALRFFSRRKEEMIVVDRAFDDAIRTERHLQWWHFWIWLIIGYSFVGLQGFNFYILMKGFHDGWITVGDFALVITISFGIIDTLNQLAQDFAKTSKLWGNITHGVRTIMSPITMKDKEFAPDLIIKPGKGTIVFENVKFNFKGHTSLFRDKTVTIKAGEKVGLVGYSGSGKSTFVHLILRLYDVSGGAILIDGQDIRDVTQDSLRKSISMIPQDTSLFHRNLMENIRYGRPEATDDEVIEAAKRAHCDEFIDKLPQKYNTMVGERGVKLSGGQRQRIAIARAILKNAPIVILDEATSALDSVTEQQIQKTLYELMEGRTTLVIAHRLSTLNKMDRILVFDEGHIVESGTPQELLEMGGHYYNMWELQAGGFLPDSRN